MYHQPSTPGAAKPVAAASAYESPAQLTGLSNSPNPFNPTNQISYQLRQSAATTLSIYDLLGQRIRLLVQGDQGIGHY